MDITEKNHKLFSALQEALPLSLWQAVYKEANRSNLSVFKTGSIVFNNNTDIIGKGCSHFKMGFTSQATVHAEEAAIANCDKPHNKLNSFSIVIMSIGRASNPAFSSKPCFSCLSRIVKANIKYVFWPERDNAGNWSVCCEQPELMYDNAILNGKRMRDFARQMRL